MFLPACHHAADTSRTPAAQNRPSESSSVDPPARIDGDYAPTTESRPEDPQVLLTRSVQVQKSVPDHAQPVAAGIAVAPTEIAPGGYGVVVLRIATAPTWHVYPPQSDLPPMYAPLSPTLTLPAGVSPKGPWHWPRSHLDPLAQVHVLNGEFELRQLVHVEEDMRPGRFEIICDLGYQACDPTMCLPPTSRKLIALIEIVSEDD